MFRQHFNDVCIVWCELLGANPYVKEAEASE